MKLFTVNEDKSLQTADNPALRIYNKIVDVEADISNLDIGQLVGTVQSTVPTEDFQSFLDYLQRIIPAGTSEGNMLVNQSQIPDVEPAFDEIRGRLDTIEDEIPNKADKNDLNQLAARVGVNETNIANLSDQVTNVETSVAELADCPGLNCTGTLTEDDIVGLTSCLGTVTGIYDKVGNTTFYPNEDGIVTVELAAGGGDSLPAGTVIPYAGATTPNGWLPCEGQEVSRDEYPALFEAIGTTYGAGDGVSTFKIPDYREVALVGIGTSTRQEGVHSPYTLGQFKDDQIQNITGQVAIMGNGVNNAYWIPTAATGAFKVGNNVGGNDAVTPNVAQNNGKYLNFDASGSVRTGGETRGKRMGVNYIIKWTRQGSSEDQNDIDTIVKNRVMTALAKANEDLYKNISITTVSTGITGFGQTYTIRNDGLYLARVQWSASQTYGNVSFRINGTSRASKPCSSLGNNEFTVTFQLKKGDTISPNYDSSSQISFSSFYLYYMGRLDLTAGFSGGDWDWNTGGGSGLTEEQVNALIDAKLAEQKITVIPYYNMKPSRTSFDNNKISQIGQQGGLYFDTIDLGSNSFDDNMVLVPRHFANGTVYANNYYRGSDGKLIVGITSLVDYEFDLLNSESWFYLIKYPKWN